ncbi:MAG: hypothetical protein MUF78_06380 [Candidatus Edwardsbacteria bacterium]|jgi:hypothetical protein|nr:hypothetical protein [Candidatus Edwardsbacteria bacterium]
MQQLAVEKRTVPVLVRFEDGQELKGDLFLSRTAKRRAGQETVLDYMNEAEEFFPLKVAEDRTVRMINKRRVIALEVAAAVEFGDEETATAGAKQERMTVIFKTHHRLSGTGYIEMPPQKSRIIDFLNQGSQFFLMKDGGTAHVCNRKQISYVIPGGD